MSLGTTISKKVLLLSSLALTAAMLSIVILSDSVTGADAKPVLRNVKMKSLEGDEISLDHERLKGKRAAFLYVAPWSAPARTQAQQVLAHVDKLKGEVVILCCGDVREARALREKLGASKHLWCRADDPSLATALAVAFDDLATLDRVPALIVMNAENRVLHASTGELSDADVAKALAAAE